MTVTDRTDTDVGTGAGTDRIATLEAKIDLLTDRIAVLTDEAEQRARQRGMRDELGSDLNRISGEALAMLTRELESLSATSDLGDTVRLLRRLAEAAPTLDRTLVAFMQAAALVDDVAPLSGDMLSSLTQRLADAEQRGYFTFARAGARIADRVVTSFDEDDIEQLGDNVVTILDTVREITQPELLTLLGRMIEAVRAEQRIVADEGASAPSYRSIARQLRDPDVRRGIARALHTFRAVSANTAPPHDPTSCAPPPSNPSASTHQDEETAHEYDHDRQP